MTLLAKQRFQLWLIMTFFLLKEVTPDELNFRVKTVLQSSGGHDFHESADDMLAMESQDMLSHPHVVFIKPPETITKISPNITFNTPKTSRLSPNQTLSNMTIELNQTSAKTKAHNLTYENPAHISNRSSPTNITTETLLKLPSFIVKPNINQSNQMKTLKSIHKEPNISFSNGTIDSMSFINIPEDSKFNVTNTLKAKTKYFDKQSKSNSTSITDINEQIRNQSTIIEINEELKDQSPLKIINEQLKVQSPIIDINEQINNQSTILDINEQLKNQSTIKDINEQLNNQSTSINEQLKDQFPHPSEVKITNIDRNLKASTEPSVATDMEESPTTISPNARFSVKFLSEKIVTINGNKPKVLKEEINNSKQERYWESEEFNPEMVTVETSSLIKQGEDFMTGDTINEKSFQEVKKAAKNQPYRLLDNPYFYETSETQNPKPITVRDIIYRVQEVEPPMITEQSQQVSHVISGYLKPSPSKHGYSKKHEEGFHKGEGDKGRKGYETSKGYKGNHYGDYGKKENSKYKDKGGKKVRGKEHKENYFGDKKEGKKGAKGHKFGKKGKRNKGHSNKGYKNISHKEEYHVTKKFYDDADDSDYHKKYDDFDSYFKAAKGQKKKGNSFEGNKAHDKHGKKKFNKEGKFFDDHAGKKSKFGKKGHHSKHGKHGHKGHFESGHSSGKKGKGHGKGHGKGRGHGGHGGHGHHEHGSHSERRTVSVPKRRHHDDRDDEERYYEERDRLRRHYEEGGRHRDDDDDDEDQNRKYREEESRDRVHEDQNDRGYHRRDNKRDIYEDDEEDEDEEEESRSVRRFESRDRDYGDDRDERHHRRKDEEIDRFYDNRDDRHRSKNDDRHDFYEEDANRRKQENLKHLNNPESFNHFDSFAPKQEGTTGKTEKVKRQFRKENRQEDKYIESPSSIPEEIVQYKEIPKSKLSHSEINTESSYKNETRLPQTSTTAKPEYQLPSKIMKLLEMLPELEVLEKIQNLTKVASENSKTSTLALPKKLSKSNNIKTTKTIPANTTQLPRPSKFEILRNQKQKSKLGSTNSKKVKTTLTPLTSPSKIVKEAAPNLTRRITKHPTLKLRSTTSKPNFIKTKTPTTRATTRATTKATTKATIITTTKPVKKSLKLKSELKNKKENRISQKYTDIKKKKNKKKQKINSKKPKDTKKKNKRKNKRKKLQKMKTKLNSQITLEPVKKPKQNPSDSLKKTIQTPSGLVKNPTQNPSLSVKKLTKVLTGPVIKPIQNPSGPVKKLTKIPTGPVDKLTLPSESRIEEIVKLNKAPIKNKIQAYMKTSTIPEVKNCTKNSNNCTSFSKQSSSSYVMEVHDSDYVMDIPVKFSNISVFDTHKNITQKPNLKKEASITITEMTKPNVNKKDDKDMDFLGLGVFKSLFDKDNTVSKQKTHINDKVKPKENNDNTVTKSVFKTEIRMNVFNNASNNFGKKETSSKKSPEIKLTANLEEKNKPTKKSTDIKAKLALMKKIDKPTNKENEGKQNNQNLKSKDGDKNKTKTEIKLESSNIKENKNTTTLNSKHKTTTSKTTTSTTTDSIGIGTFQDPRKRNIVRSLSVTTKDKDFKTKPLQIAKEQNNTNNTTGKSDTIKQKTKDIKNLDKILKKDQTGKNVNKNKLDSTPFLISFVKKEEKKN